MADKKEPRYRVTEVREYLKLSDDTVVKAGSLIPKGVEVEDWLIDLGWVKEE